MESAFVRKRDSYKTIYTWDHVADDEMTYRYDTSECE